MKLTDKLFSVVNNRCPKCHKSSVFQTNNPYNLKRFDKMNSSCACCGETYYKEPGFFYGAMIVSYMLNGALFIFAFLGIYIPLDIEAVPFIVVMSSLVVVLSPITFRLARLVWLNVFIAYDPEVKCVISEAVPA
jgi:uncharacterized protein (DUF983 family)